MRHTGNVMGASISNRLAHGMPFALLIGAALFFVAGPWVVDALSDYGFSWSPTPAQELAFLLAWLMSLPTSLIVGSADPPRALLAINGAIWGCLLYSAWMLVIYIAQRRRAS